MKKFAFLTGLAALGTLSLALAKPSLPPTPEKPKPSPVSDYLAPKMVKLNLTNVSVVDAIAELSRQSGYGIQIVGDRSVLANRMITLQTGEVSFFQAMDQLCAKGGLVEKNTGPSAIGGRPIIMPNPFPNPPVPLPPGGGAGGAGGGVGPNIKPRPAKQPAAPPGLQGGVQAEGAGVAQVQIQVQVQPGAQIQPAPGQPGIQIQIQPGGAAIQPAPIGGMRPFPGNQQFMLADGKPLEVPTVYAGAVRIRLLPASTFNMAIQPGETLLVFEVTAEPRLQSFNVVGMPQITKAIDDLGQTLTVVNQVIGKQMPNVNVPNIQIQPPNGQPVPKVQPAPRQGKLPAQAQPQPAIAPGFARINYGMQRIVTVRLKLGEKQAKMIKELTGTLTVQFMSPPEAVATIDNVMQAKGQSAKSKNNDVIVTLDSIEKVGDAFRAQVTLEQQPRGGAGIGIAPVPPAPPGAPRVAPPQVQPPQAAPPAPNGAQIQLPQAAPGQLPQIQLPQIQLPAGGGGVGGAVMAFPPVVNPGNMPGLPSLVDAQGKVYQVTQVSSRFQPGNPGAPVKRIYTIDYRADAGQAQPARLVLNQTRLVTVPIPFTFNNVPLR